MKRWNWMAAGMLLAAALGAAGAETPATASTTGTDCETVSPAEMTTEESTTTEPSVPFRDPFAMHAEAEEGYVSAKLESIPAGIQVAGILTAEGRPSIGALFIPGSKSLHFVQEGEIIQLDSTGSASGTPGGSQVYLLVKTITDHQIEIAPQARPQDVRIYR